MEVSNYHERAERVRARLCEESIGTANDIRGRVLFGRTLRALQARCETYLPVNVPSVRIEGSAGLKLNTGRPVPAHAVAPDAIEGSRHDVKRGRTKRGPTAEVKRYGLAHVVGSWTGTAVTASDDLASFPVLAEVLEQSGKLKRGAYGVSALDVYRMTQRLYGDLIPALLSTDNQQHHAVVHGDDSDTDDYAIAWHNPADPYAACDATGRTVPDSSITYPRRGYGLTFGLPAECVTDRWRAAAWLASKRETSSADAGRIMARRVRTGPESTKRVPSRFALKAAARRAGDPVARWEALQNGYGAVYAVMTGHPAYRWHLVSADDRTAVRNPVILSDRPCIVMADGTRYNRQRVAVTTGPPTHVWHGLKRVARTEPKHGTTVAGKRSRQTVKRRTVEHVAVSTFAELLARFATVANGERITWSVGTKRGAFTRAADGRYSATDETGPIVKSVRTLDAVRIKLERAAA